MLEEGSFRDRTADFVMMFLFGAVFMIVSFILYLFLLELKIVCEIITYAMLVLSSGLLINISLDKNLQAFAFVVNLLFLGQAFTIMLVYIWSRRNPLIRMNFFGILNFYVSVYHNLYVIQGIIHLYLFHRRHISLGSY